MKKVTHFFSKEPSKKEEFEAFLEQFIVKACQPEEAPVQEEVSEYTRAMEVLAGDYVRIMEEFYDAENPLHSWHALNEAEDIWRQQMHKIALSTREEFEEENPAQPFLQGVRREVFRILQKKLTNLAPLAKESKEFEYVAVCMGILSTMDVILEEMGFEKEDEERLRLRSLVRQFR